MKVVDFFSKSSLDLEDIFKKVMYQVKELMNVDCSIMWFIDNDRN